ncbi:MAG: phosphatase PAP2 family protein [Bacteroidales bacterium]|nr:phosphatase PAP2 family protein [Bacteroidales bacterium]
MLEYLQQLDAQLLCALNGMNCPYADQLMWLISGKFSSALIVIVLLALLARHRQWRNMITLLLAIALVVVLADRVSSGIIKPLVERLRPTHNPELQGMVHIVNDYRGGLYGFVSSHAANLFGIATLISMVMKNRGTWIAMLSWAAIVSYSRIYLGVHYPGDIVGGIAVGMAAAVAVKWAWKKTPEKWNIPRPERLFAKADAKILNLAVALNVLIIAVIAALF